jgi:hypothetical protein
MSRSLCPVCEKYVTVARDPEDGSLYLSLHGSWPLCDGSGQCIVDLSDTTEETG